MTERLFLNHYECNECDTAWSDVWTCACNDRCPTCNTETEPSESLESKAWDED